MIDTNHLLQSEIWKKSKELLDQEIFNFSSGFGTISKFPILGFRIGYISRIYVDENLISEVEDIGRRLNLSYIQVDPLNLEPLNLQLNKTKPVQLKKTYVINLEKSSDEYFESFKGKDRYYIRKGEKDGLVTKFETGDECFYNFSKIYDLTMRRHKTIPRSYNYLKNVYEAANKYDSIIFANTYFGNQLLVSSLIIIHDQILYYLYTGSSLEHRELRASFYHVWNVIKWGIEKKMKYLDLFGIDEQKGFSDFKLKFSGEIIEYADSFDIVINKFSYSLIKFLLKFRKIFNK